MLKNIVPNIILLTILAFAGEIIAANDSIFVNSSGVTIFKASTSSIDSITFASDPNLRSCYGQCANGFQCVDGTCALSCQAGLTNCSGKCVDITTDPNNCGRCGTAVASGYQCQSGVSVVSCQAGLTNCSGKCVDITTDPNNCGRCGTAIASGYQCQSGVSVVSCQAGLTNCSGKWSTSPLIQTTVGAAVAL